MGINTDQLCHFPNPEVQFVGNLGALGQIVHGEFSHGLLLVVQR